MTVPKEIVIQVYESALKDAIKFGDRGGKGFIERQLMRLGVLVPTPTVVRERKGERP